MKPEKCIGGEITIGFSKQESNTAQNLSFSETLL